jgi:protein-tyrosine phosphatase
MKILMVCLGNICRSPMADGLLRRKVAELKLPVEVDSAGTSGLHSGEAPDPRMRATAKQFGTSIEDLRARQFSVADFDTFDMIYVMDQSNLKNVLTLAQSEEQRKKVKLILDELEGPKGLEVPDPYYGGNQGFIDVYQLLDKATDRILEKIR